MPVMTPDQFIEDSKRWMKDEIHRIKKMWPLRGGWEAWTQAELAAMFFLIDSRYSVLREQPVFVDPRRRCDLLINSGIPNVPVAQNMVIELKCQSFENRNEFRAGLLADVQKLQDANIVPALFGCFRMSTGFFFDKGQVPDTYASWFDESGDIGMCWFQVTS